MDPPRLATLCARGAPPLEDEPTRSVVPPIYPSTTYARDAEHALPSLAGAPLCYARPDNPSVRACERALCVLEGGSDCAMFSSGMAAVTAVLEGWYRVTASCRRRRALVPADGYFAVRAHIVEWCAARGIPVEMYAPDARSELPGTFWCPKTARPLREFVHEQLETASNGCRSDLVTTLLWVEPMANPTWDVIDALGALDSSDLRTLAQVYTCVDSTVLTPICCRPLEQFGGCDVVMHSATKYLNGHSDVVAGALVTRSRDDTWDAILHHRKFSGATMGSFDAYLLARGMRTLEVRVRRQSETAMYIAEYFEENKDDIGPRPGSVRVLYPGYSKHTGDPYPPHYELARKICPHGIFGGMLSIVFTVDILPPEDRNLRNLSTLCQKFAVSCPHWTCATSLGGFESLIEHRYSVECKPGDETPHIPVGLLRLSVGLEDRGDLVRGLLSGINAVCGLHPSTAA